MHHRPSRCWNQEFADKLGVSIGYVEVMLSEPFVISNPSARLLTRMAVLLDVSVGYLLGETRDTDPIWVQSNASWRSWMRENLSVETNVAFEIWDEWKADHRRPSRTSSLLSFRDPQKPMTAVDWDKRYKQGLNEKAKDHELQKSLF
jgi:transcriptional regulator with XRE-family HTH domain